MVKVRLTNGFVTEYNEATAAAMEKKGECIIIPPRPADPPRTPKTQEVKHG